MSKKWFISAVVIPLAAVSCARKRVVIVPALKPDVQLTRVATPLEVIPASADLAPGATRLFFARIITTEDKTFRYDANLFVWKVQEPDGGTVVPSSKSLLYYSYTAPTKPGYYHLLVSLKDRPTVQALVSVKVGSPDKTAAPELAAEKRRPNGASLPE